MSEPTQVLEWVSNYLRGQTGGYVVAACVSIPDLHRIVPLIPQSGRSVVHDDNFDGWLRLIEDRRKSRFNVSRLVVGRDDDTDSR